MGIDSSSWLATSEFIGDVKILVSYCTTTYLPGSMEEYIHNVRTKADKVEEHFGGYPKEQPKYKPDIWIEVVKAGSDSFISVEGEGSSKGTVNTNVSETFIYPYDRYMDSRRGFEAPRRAMLSAYRDKFIGAFNNWLVDTLILDDSQFPIKESLNTFNTIAEFEFDLEDDFYIQYALNFIQSRCPGYKLSLVVEGTTRSILFDFKR